MNRVDLHPEHLIDRQALADLSPAQAADLRAHLRECDACRLELSLRSALQVGQDNAPLSAGLIDAAMSAAGVDPGGEVRAPAAPARSQIRRAGKWRRAAPVLVAFLAGAAAAAAAGGTWWAKRAELPVASPVVQQPKLAAAPASSVQPSAPPLSTGPASSAAPVTARHSEGRPLKASPEERATAASLFADATAARRSGAAGRAAELYRQLQRDFPSSPEAGTSRLSLGRLELHQLGRPAAALRELDAYLAGGGSLQQEALLGKAQALEQLGRGSEARAAYRLILERYPDSIYADQAKLRLERGR